LPPVSPSPVVIVPSILIADCTQDPPREPKGALVNVVFENLSEGDVLFSFGMIDPNPQNECGTYSYSFVSAGATPAKILAGCYWGYGWITGGLGSSTTQTDERLCLTDVNTTYHVLIMKEKTVLQ
jgi:hypothetical protein